ncbi:glycine-rich RNA-binding protein 1-like [Heracleum sosnowskyi]|uniref:Glycine-rich RNA-binding protein 1-like n=1 Tax=Heracleum sosnowskyi TaxID=360622 RepID=A0AAD8GT43_9APIA|nr:glycine-rich RNA-binding protein 1-like [Heracleum sosnowskyi]
MKLNIFLMLGLLLSLVILVSSIDAAVTPKHEKKGDHEATKPDQYGYGPGYGYGDYGPGYGGYGPGYGGYGPGYGGYGPGYGGGGWGGRRCWYGCCGRSFWGGGCRSCCRSGQEAQAYNLKMANADEANP